MLHLVRRTPKVGCLRKGSCQGDVDEGIGFRVTPVESGGV